MGNAYAKIYLDENVLREEDRVIKENKKQILNFIATPKVYNKNEVEADLNDFFGRIKLKANLKDMSNKKNDDESRLFKQNKNKKINSFK